MVGRSGSGRGEPESHNPESLCETPSAKPKGRCEVCRDGSGGHGVDGPEGIGRVGLQSVPEIPVALAVQPELRGGPEETREPKGGVGCNPTLSVDDLVDSWEGDVDPLSQLGLGHVHRLQELLEEHLAGMGRRAVFGKHSGQEGRGSAMVVDDFNAVRPGISPFEANAVPVVDPEAVLASAVSEEEFQPVSGWGAQVIKGLGLVELVKLALGHAPEIRRTGPHRDLGANVMEDLLGSSVPERSDHRRV